MDKVLIICGPTATGKTKFALEMAKGIGGEIVSADSRQVYAGKNLIYGKDLPSGLLPQISNLKWRDRQLKFYEVEGVRIWLYDIVRPPEPFSVAFWRDCADLVIADIQTRSLLPIVVGGSGLYIKSLVQSLLQITIPPNANLRLRLANKHPDYLFDYLNKLDSARAATLNSSDRQNPRRLLRAIEIAVSGVEPQTDRLTKRFNPYSFLQIGLTAPRPQLYARIDQRIRQRLADGAALEDASYAANPIKWQSLEHHLARRQLTWFKTQPGVQWFDITQSMWQFQAENLVRSWYNSAGHA